MAAANGSVYGIPGRARPVVKFNPTDRTITDMDLTSIMDLLIGIHRGAMTESGIIYCPPYYENRGIFKIETNANKTTELDANLLPERGELMWTSGATDRWKSDFSSTLYRPRRCKAVSICFLHISWAASIILRPMSVSSSSTILAGSGFDYFAKPVSILGLG